MLSIWPAIITGGVGIVAALTSTLLAFYSIKQTTIDKRDSRAHSLAEQILPRRLDAYETVWARLFELEHSGSLSDQAADQLVAVSVWLPENLRNNLLGLAVSHTTAIDKNQLSEVRHLLLADRVVTNLDIVTTRLGEPSIKEGTRGR